MDKEKKFKQLQEKVNLIFCDIDNDLLLKKIKEISAEDILKQIFDSGLRGRGGAGFPTGIKWKAAADANTDIKYVICNADEGEPGTFKDRKILSEKVEKVFMGMALCSKSIGSNKGYIYLRGEYNFLVPDLLNKLTEYNKKFKEIGLNFTIDIFSGSGAYVCGEETSLIESMEGNRGEPRNKPPFPVTNGYMGKPTVINNVETFAYATMIINDGPEKFKSIGTKDSK
jgi:[NiFe] hydrogenase diaphorase moiety large subunit